MALAKVPGGGRGRPRPCLLAEADRDPLGRPPRDYDLFTPWGPSESEVLAPDDPADALLGVTRPVGSFRTPCGVSLRTLIVTAFEGFCPDVEFPDLAVPFRLPRSGRLVWLRHELL